jgi:Fur family transcriptional regulator, zinc uptake regulator
MDSILLMLYNTVMSINKTAESIAKNFGFTLTALRKDILDIFLQAQEGSLTAYQVLEQLKKNRKNAQPPTVYRVLDFLSQNCVIHRINSGNSYILCQVNGHDHNACEIVVFCQKCHKVNEFSDAVLAALLQKLAKEHQITIDTHLVELQGLCQKCLTL